MNALQTMQKKLKNRKGFTLMEMLIVVAIIAILVAIAIPTFNSALNNAKKATDDANLRAAKAVLISQTMLAESGETDVTKPTVGMVFNPETGVFVESSAKPDDYGKYNGHDYIVVESIGVNPTVKWNTEQKP